MLKRRFSRALVALLIVVSVFCQGTLVLAGTTGTLEGTATDSATNLPLAGAKVSIASPSEIASGTTDSHGHFTFLSLAPDTYNVSVQFGGYDASTITGVTVVADNTRTLAVTVEKTLKTIARVTTRSASSLVKPGTTADVYSINSQTQAKVAAAGGGGNLDSAFSALATVPGVVVMPGQSGYIGAAADLSIRGGDYDQIGYEIDGVPVNRSFDNYPSGPTSSLGQQELQVYTGAPPADSLSDGISGYINQVIKTGTSPGFENLTVADGGPAYYHKLSFEVGGATPNRLFSYYIGIGGYNQTLRVYDQYNGQDLSSTYGTPAGFCTSEVTGVALTYAQAPSCYANPKTPYANDSAAYGGPAALGSFDLNSSSEVVDRDNVVNLHYYVPHKDGSRDDLQLLYQTNYLYTPIYSSPDDLGGPSQAGLLEGTFGDTPTYLDGYQLKLPTGGFLPSDYKSYAAPYYFPNTPTHAFDGPIDAGLQDASTNNQSIEKIQYTKSLGSNAYARVYGYGYYSNWLISGANSNQSLDGDNNGDYELSAHTRGLSFQLADQLNAQNLLQFGGDYTTSNVVRDNNTEYVNGAYGPDDVNNRTVAAVLVNASNPTAGICYTLTGAATPCLSSTSATGLSSTAAYATLQQAYNGSIAQPAAGTTCGTGKCAYLVVGNGEYATYNQVTPNFYGLSLTDEFRPTSKLTVNAGLRLDDYQFAGSDTSGGPARAFFYNAFNREECVSTTTQLVAPKLSTSDTALSQSCPAGYSNADFTNPSGNVTETYPVFQPRLGATYSVNPTTVLRASYGRFAEPPNSAFEQYNASQANAPALLYGTYGFQQYGYTTPNHPIPPATSSNYDFSIEHQFPAQLAVKISPFLRSTQNQSENFFLNRVTSFVSGLNVGNQTSRGVEFELDKGNFAQNGLSGKLSFAYTNSTIKYNTLSNGTTVLTPVVNAVNSYNALTKAGGGAPCYLANATTAGGAAIGGTADPSCAPATVSGMPLAAVANPYYNAPEQSVAPYAPGATTIPYSLIPAGIGLDDIQIGAPYDTTLVLNEKINKFSIAPVVQFIAGQRYGDPLSTEGIDPTTCTATLAGSTAGDPRYKYGPGAGSPYNAQDCGVLSGGIPDAYTGGFDGAGAFVEPAQLLLHLQIAYEATKNFTLTANITNIVNTCVGGSKVAWAVSGACQYGVAALGSLGYGGVGNTYNPGDVIQPALKQPYGPVFSQQPFGIFVSGNFKL